MHMINLQFIISILIALVLSSFQSLGAQVPDTLWTRTYGGSNIDVGHCVQQTTDGGFIIVGYTRSFGTMSGRNMWLLKTDSLGNLEWNNAFGGDDDDEGYSVYLTQDGGYIMAGYTKSFGAGMKDVLLVKADTSGTLKWMKVFGGVNDDEAYSVQQTIDQGYIIAGVTSSYGSGSRDVWLIKTNIDGNLEWQKTLGGFGSDGAMSVQQTTDGGYIVTGWTFSAGPGYLGNMWLVKTDSLGNESWNTVFGGSDVDRGYSVQQTSDGGYIVAGYTDSFGAGLYDVLLFKADHAGNQEWYKTFGGSGRDYGYSVQQTIDGGYIIAGYTLSFGAGGDDVWIIKTDSLGNEKWNSTFGGVYSDVGYSVKQTVDGGYIIAGHTLSFGSGVHDVYLIRLAPEPAPVFNVSPDTLFFGVVTPGDTLIDSVTVKNSGNADLIITSIVSSNPLFGVSPTTLNLPPDSSAQIFVEFRTDSLNGLQSGELIFYHNGFGSPDTVLLLAEVVTATTHWKGKIPNGILLYPNYPNPFNSSTRITYQLPKQMEIELLIFNLLGATVRTLAKSNQSAGIHDVWWDGKDDSGREVASGVYIFRLKVADKLFFRKLLLIR
ncbi:MAG: hypothetical protein Kow0042_30430 [Calditrichia bacterium]